MTQDEIIRMAREAGFEFIDQFPEDFQKLFERFAALVAAPLQAKIDRLMLEYCPDEMTPEQLAEWAANQKPASQEPVLVNVNERQDSPMNVSLPLPDYRRTFKLTTGSAVYAAPQPPKEQTNDL